MSRHNPIFPTDDLVLQTDAALPSSVSSTSQIATGHSYIDGLSRAHAKLAAVPQELCDSPCPASESHVDLIRDKTRSALKYANHDPSDAKWSHVARILRMASTSRKYRGIAEGVRAGEVKNVEVGDYKWVLPATEAEWADCEKRWKQRSLTAVGPTRASRYWADSGNKVAEQDAQAGTPSKAALVRHKVKQWQATVLPATQGSLLPPSGDQLLAKKAESGKEKEGEPKRQSPLTFPVTKRSAVAGSKINVVGEPLAQYPHDPPAALQITDLSEMSFLPPSFPSQLETSTPPPLLKAKPVRQKPPPIPFRLFDSSPSSSPRMPNSSLEQLTAALPASSNLSGILPLPSSLDRPGKRPRPTTPPTDEDIPPTSRTPPHKKARLQTTDRSFSSVPLSPSTPPPSTTPPRTPPQPVSTGKGLGNAKGLPVPSTPNQAHMPTLSQLLASSRRSKPRPRPPSRKSKSRGNTPALSAKDPHTLPVLADVREPSPAPTVARTLLSSPASGSSMSTPESIRDRPGSPVSPLFGQKSGGFVPPFTSTQAGGGFGGMGASQGQGALLGRGSSGVFGMGYNSQFDVEGQVGLVSDLLERDVDFDGWLRDIPEVEAEG